MTVEELRSTALKLIDGMDEIFPHRNPADLKRATELISAIPTEQYRQTARTNDVRPDRAATFASLRRPARRSAASPGRRSRLETNPAAIPTALHSKMRFWSECGLLTVSVVQTRTDRNRLAP